MRFKIKKSPLQTGLEKAAYTVSSKDNDPLLKTFNIHADTETDPDEVRILSTDLSLGSIAKIRVVDIQEPGVICVPAQKFVSIVRAAEDGDIEFEVEENQAKIKAARATWQINILDPGDYPKVPVFNKDESEEVNREKLIAVLNKVRYAASTDEVRAALMLIAFNGKRAATSDGGRLQCADFKGLEGVQIPIFAVPNLLRLLNRTEVETIRVQLDKNHLLFQIGADTFSTQRLYDEFPNVEEAILKPTEANKQELTIDKDALKAAIERVRIAADEDRKQLNLEVLSPTNGDGPTEVQISALDPNGELATETLACSTDLEPGRNIIVNHQFFGDMLEMATSAQVTLKLGEDTRARRSPIRMEEPGLKSVLLQLREE